MEEVLVYESEYIAKVWKGYLFCLLSFPESSSAEDCITGSKERPWWLYYLFRNSASEEWLLGSSEGTVLFQLSQKLNIAHLHPFLESTVFEELSRT